MKSKFIFGLLVALLILSVSSCAERVDAGYEGIKVNLYGDDKGVDKVTLVTGMVWYNPITTAIYEYPTFVQTVDYPPFSVNAKDGSSFVVDPTISLKIVDGKSAEVFKKYRKVNITEVINTTLYNYVRNAFRIQLNAYTTDELVSKREEFEKAMDDDFNTADAIAAIFELVKYANTTATAESSKEYLRGLLDRIVKLGDVLGLILDKKEELLDADIEKLIEERQAARKAKDFARADAIRDELLEKGIILKDTREGVQWKKA